MKRLLVVGIRDAYEHDRALLDGKAKTLNQAAA